MIKRMFSRYFRCPDCGGPLVHGEGVYSLPDLRVHALRVLTFPVTRPK